jgi:hypothetical protein
MKTKWINSSIKKPSVDNRFGESDYILCIDKISHQQFVGWYDKNLKQWFVAHHLASNQPVNVSHWTPLPSEPGRL